MNIDDIQCEYLPICKKKIRSLVKNNVPFKIIGGRMYVERFLLEKYLSDYQTKD